MITVLTNGVVHTGDEVLRDRCVVIDDRVITDVARTPPAHARVIDLAGRSVAPGFVDLQVNGGGDVLFNDRPDAEGVRAIAAAHRGFGVTDLLPTFITGPVDAMRAAAAAVDEARRTDPGVLGIHFEGPHLNPRRLGVHDPAYRRDPDEETTAALTALGDGRTVVTLAPETVPAGYVRALVEAGIVVAAGHTDAGAREIRAALAEGATLGTHLWNAMSPPTSREPGAVGTLLDAAWCGVIADGHHVDWATLRLSLRAGRLVLVSDAMPCVGGRRAGFRLGDLDITVRDGRCETAGGMLAGSALDLASAVCNVVRELDVPLDEALRLASTYPAQAIGLGDVRGRIEPGYPAHLVVFDDQIRVSGVYYAGSYVLT